MNEPHPPIPNASQVQLALDVVDLSFQPPDPSVQAVPEGLVQQSYATIARALNTPGWTGQAAGVEAYGSTRHLTDEVIEKAHAFDAVAEVLYPGGNLDHEWTQDTIEDAARHVRPIVEARQ